MGGKERSSFIIWKFEFGNQSLLNPNIYLLLPPRLAAGACTRGLFMAIGKLIGYSKRGDPDLTKLHPICFHCKKKLASEKLS